LRFRAYLGEQYKRRDLVEVASGKVEKSLPIICIFLLGFKIDGIETSAMRVDRRYFDMIKQCEIKQKSTWVESLTHDGYFVQIPRIEGKPLTILEKLLSVFEQQYFIDDKSTLKDYEYPIDDDNLKMMVEILKHAASDEKTRREMEEAWYSEENEKEYDRIKEELQKSKQSLAEQQKSLAEKDQSLAEHQKSLAEKDQSLAEHQKSLAEHQKSLAEKDQSLAEKDQSLAEKDKEIAELRKLLENKIK